MKGRNYIFLLAGTWFGLSVSCKHEEAGTQEVNNQTSGERKVYDEWLIDLEKVEDGCERLDCIKSIDDPVFISADRVDFLQDDDLIIGVRMGDELHAYPHNILNWHEIVNDFMDDTYLSINYCPLTGSGMAWNRTINGKLTEFGVSGLLYNSNVIPYDRTTRSAWSQMKQVCVNGELYEKKAQTFQVIETSWATWKTMFPDSKVVSTETGMQRDYSSYPYGTYRDDKEIYFEVDQENDTLHPKERLYGIVSGDEARCYRFANFKNGLRILSDTAFGKNIIVVGSERDNYITAFQNPSNLIFTPNTGQMPGIMRDAEGNVYDVFGYCISGTKMGTRLTPMNGFTAYWFAWYAFYPTIQFK